MKRKCHLFRNSRETWCGRPVGGLEVTRNVLVADCKVCIKADAVEQAKQIAASV